MDKKITLSALGAVYANDNPQHFELAIRSVLEQTIPACEIVLVVDGPLTNSLEKVIQFYSKSLKILRLKHNVGLGPALNYGLKKCNGDYVARWDADDIQVKERFEYQLSFFKNNKNIVVIGGAIEEFQFEIGDLKQIRQVPSSNSCIIDFAKKRNPVNHVTVMFDKKFIKKIGGYHNVAYMEDYDLWLRVIEAAGIINNIDKVLAYVRVGNGMLSRRGGLKNIQSEIKLLKRKRAVYGNSPIVYFWTALRVSLRLIPGKTLGVIYKKFLRKK